MPSSCLPTRFPPLAFLPRLPSPPACLSPLQHRKSLVELWRKGILQLKDEQEAAQAASGQAAANARAPRHGATVTVQTETERQLEKLRRKEGKKMAKAGHAGGAPGSHKWDPSGDDEEGGLVAEAGGFLALVEASENTSGARGMLDALIGTGNDAVAMRLLPIGTQRRQYKGYEEVHVPAPKKSTQAPQENLVRGCVPPVQDGLCLGSPCSYFEERG